MKYLQLTFVPMKKFNSLVEVAYRPANSAYATIRYCSSGPILTKNFEEREKLAHSWTCLGLDKSGTLPFS